MPKPNIEFESLGTHWWIEILDEVSHEAAEQAILARVSAFHDDYSRFIPESFIGRLNSDKQLVDPPVELIDMLTFAHDISHATDNVFNLSVASSLGQLGYGTAASTSRVDDKLWDHVTFDKHLITLPPDVEIDLGGFGKGWIIDSLGELLHSLGHSQFIINGGGDILVSSDEPIELALEHPLDPTKQIGSTRITHGALAVSSTKKRVWKQGDAQYHHIIDPQTGLPSTSPIATTYVRADTALIADTLATVLLIDPSQNEKLTQAYNLKTILINEDQLL